MTEREFAECIAFLCASVGKEMTGEQIKAWFAMLGDLSQDQLKNGIIKTVRNYKFAGFPPVGVIRENCGAISVEIAAKDRPTLAWEAVRRAVNRVGIHDSVQFDDVTIHAAIRSMGGWVALCESTSEEMVWREKDFLRTYAALMTLPLGSEQTERLCGITECENGRALPVRVVRVGCLTTETSGEQRFIEQQKPARITGPTVAAEHLVKRLECDDRKPLVHVPRRSVDEQLKLISAIGSRKS